MVAVGWEGDNNNLRLCEGEDKILNFVRVVEDCICFVKKLLLGFENRIVLLLITVLFLAYIYIYIGN